MPRRIVSTSAGRSIASANARRTLASSNGGSAGPPELIARGFGDGSGPLLDELRDEADRVLQRCLSDEISEIKLLQEHLHDGIGQLVYDRTGRRPMILPIVVEV